MIGFAIIPFAIVFKSLKRRIIDLDFIGYV